MATKQSEPAVIYPAPAGCGPHERSGWLPDLPLAWLQTLRERHEELAQIWARTANDVEAIREEAGEREAEYRRVVRQATADGAEIPPRAGEMDPARWEARLSIALEDATAARDDLAECVIDALASLREHRADLQPHLSQLSPALLSALSSGTRDQRAIVAERLRRQLAELEGDGPAIEVLDDPEGDTPDLKGGDR